MSGGRGHFVATWKSYSVHWQEGDGVNVWRERTLCGNLQEPQTSVHRQEGDGVNVWRGRTLCGNLQELQTSVHRQEGKE